MGKIQILGLRDFAGSDGKRGKRETFFSKGWRVEDIQDIFAKPLEVLKEVPEDQRYNLYFTVAHCFEAPGRKLENQWMIPFDIDGINVEQAEAVARVAISTLELEWNQVPVVFSGNGVQFFVGTTEPIIDEEFFDATREHYKAICGMINVALKEKDLEGTCDPSVYSKGRLMRMPETENRKPSKTTRVAKVLQPRIEYVDFNIKERSGIQELSQHDAISIEVAKKLPDADAKTIKDECAFIKHCAEAPGTVVEPQWYAMLSIVSRFPNGREEAHSLSEGHPQYSAYETDLKIDQALTNSGPRTCKNINALWEGCSGCKHFGTDLVSPILIQGENYIRTEKTGFHSTVVTAEGKVKTGKPVVEDLAKFFYREHQYVTIDESKRVFIFTGTHWTEYLDARIEAYAQQHFNPKPNTHTRNEFKNHLKCTHLVSNNFFEGTVQGKMNFKNGVLDIQNGEFTPHSPNFGFRYVLDYEYNPRAACPTFDRFMDDITEGDAERQQVLLEFAGYAFSNDSCWADKSLLLLGKGYNGKSTFIDLLGTLAGKDTYSVLSMSDIHDAAARYRLEGKLFNISEETSTTSLSDSSLFKNLVTGGEVMVKRLYSQPYEIKNRAKFIFGMNELPKSKDKTDALYRRMLIVPFTAQFTPEKGNRDPFIKKKLRQELPGIFNRIIDGYKRLKSQGDFTSSAAAEAALLAYRNENNSAIKFVQECLQVYSKSDQEHYVEKKNMYKDYSFWCQECFRERPMSDVYFYREIRKVIPDIEKREARPRINGKRLRVFFGLEYNSDGFEESVMEAL